MPTFNAQSTWRPSGTPAAAPAKGRGRSGSTLLVTVGLAGVYLALQARALCFAGQLGQTANRPSHAMRHNAAPQAAAETGLDTLRAHASLDLIKSQNAAGRKMMKLGEQLRGAKFKAQGLDGSIRVAFDGLQHLRSVEVDQGSLQAVDGNRGALADAVLTALQGAFDESSAVSSQDVWELYKENPDLAQAPLVQIGAGATAKDLWENVTQNEETVRLATEIFDMFDADEDGYWNLLETSQVQKVTEGSEMAEDAFTSLVIAAADNKGRDLTEDDLAKGLSKVQVIELYTDAQRQRSLGFRLDVYQDHAIVFGTSRAPEAVEASPAE